MAKKGRHRKGGRTTPKGTRPLSFNQGSRSAFDEPDRYRGLSLVDDGFIERCDSWEIDRS
jgi:hypothetical protein